MCFFWCFLQWIIRKHKKTQGTKINLINKNINNILTGDAVVLKLLCLSDIDAQMQVIKKKKQAEKRWDLILTSDIWTGVKLIFFKHSPSVFFQLGEFNVTIFCILSYFSSKMLEKYSE